MYMSRKTFFASILFFAALAASGAELAPNGDFSIIAESAAKGWTSASGWKGKSIYRAGRGCLAIERNEDDEGAGAFFSDPIPVTGGKQYNFSVRYRCTLTEKESWCAAAVEWKDAKGKKLPATSLFHANKSANETLASKPVIAPDGAASARLRLVLGRMGNAEFTMVSFNDDPKTAAAVSEPNEEGPEEADNRAEAPFLLNGSFEAADFSPDFTDCFVPVSGQSRRTTQAFHGYHALELSPGSSVVYGAKNVPSVSVAPGEQLCLSYAAAGTGKAVCILDFLNESGVKKTDRLELSCVPEGKEFKQVSREFRVPAGAAAAALTLVNEGNDPVVVDALYLGPKTFSAKETRVIPVPPRGGDADQSRFPRSTIENLNGRPTWYIEGEAQTKTAYTPANIRANTRPHWYNYIRTVLRHGEYPIVVLECNITPEMQGEKYTLETVMKDIDIQARTALAEIPDAKFMLWVFLEPSNAFAARYPDDLVRLEDPDAPRRYKIPAYSFGSEIWAGECMYALRELLARVSKLPYADRIAAVSPGLGQYGENNFELAKTIRQHSPQDFSPAMQDFFRKWLMKEYGSDVLRFKKAWDREGVFNFTNAQVPSKKRRVPKFKGAFYDPATQKQCIDYIRCESFSILHRVLQMCQTVKEASGGRLFTMAQLAYFTSQILHLELDMALKNPYLDALGPAPPYINRGPGDDIMDHGPAESVSEHGKLWMFQADVRSHLSSAHNWRYGRTADEKESVAVYLRDIGHYMTKGQFPYYLAFERWYDSPGLLALIARFNGWMDLGSKFPRASNAEIAVVVDPMSLATGHEYSYVRRIMPPYQSSLEYNRTFEWHHLGAPYDFFMLDDLLNRKDIRQYKVVIFAANWAISERQRALIEERLKKDGRTLVWLYAPGLIRYDGRNDVEYTLEGTKITGFEFDLSEQTHDLEITLADGQKAGRFTNKIYGGFRTPQTAIPVRPETFAPRLSVKPGEDVRITGVYSEDQAPAAAVRKTPTHTDVFWGSTALNKEVLCPILEEAGVHLYTDKPAVVYASENILMIHSPTAGKRTIRLPREAECVYDLFRGEELASGVRSFEADMEKNSTLLLYYGDRAQLSRALEETEAAQKRRESANEALRNSGKFAYELPKESKPLRAGEAQLDKIYHPDSEGFIRNWLVAGPFPGCEKDKSGFDTDYIGEETDGPVLRDARYDVVFDATPEDRRNEQLEWFNGEKKKKELSFTWRPVTFSCGVTRAVYEEISLPFSSYICYYLACVIDTPVERTLRLTVGSDDGEKSFLNGRRVTAFYTPSRRLSADSESALVTLRPGKNFLLVKIVQGLGGVGHAVRFLDPETKRPVTDLDVTLR